MTNGVWAWSGRAAATDGRGDIRTLRRRGRRPGGSLRRVSGCAKRTGRRRRFAPVFIDTTGDAVEIAAFACAVIPPWPPRRSCLRGCAGGGDLEVALSNASGAMVRRLHTPGATQARCQLGGLPAGTYTIRIGSFASAATSYTLTVGRR